VSNAERGSVTVLMAGIVCTVAVLGVVIGATGQVLAARSQASTGADASALAAAVATFDGDPKAEALRLAEANGVRLVSCDCRRDRTWGRRTVTVLVEVDVDVLGLGSRTVRARARAEYLPAGS
jgi:secretion/DNA translocation related TadE-like protein